MSKFKAWLFGRFLPAWCREELLDTNTRLTAKIQAQAQEIDRLKAYIDGMHAALRRQPRITVNAKEVSRSGHPDRTV